MQINQVFDELHDDYTAKIIRWVPYYQDLLSGLAQYLPKDFQPQGILDLGCGNGNADQLLLSIFPDAEYHLVDASAEMIAGCRERFSGKGQFQFQQSFFQDLDFPEACFDLVVACLSLHHLRAPEKVAFFLKLRKWLRPGAFFTYSDLMIDKADPIFHGKHLTEWKKEAFSKGTPEEEWVYLMEHYDTYDFPTDLEVQKDYLSQAGFDKVTVPFRVIGWTTIMAEV